MTFDNLELNQHVEQSDHVDDGSEGFSDVVDHDETENDYNCSCDEHDVVDDDDDHDDEE